MLAKGGLLHPERQVLIQPMMAYDAQESFMQSTTIFDAEKRVGDQLRGIGALN